MGWVKKKFLGQGAFGKVFRAQSSSRANHFVALKTVLACESSTLRFEKQVYDRLGASKYILKCLDSSRGFDENGREEYYLVLEYASGGTLKRLLQRRRISELEVSYFAKMLLKGLSHVHQYGFVHCDVKPDNVLVFPSRNPLINVSLKLADFGRAKRRGETSSMRLRGTLPYSSPESVRSGEHEPATDIWSFGCIVFRMLAGYGMWDQYLNAGDNVLSNMIAGYDETRLTFSGSISTSAKDFVRSCLTRSPNQRWTAAQLLRHPFITEQHFFYPTFHKICLIFPQSS